MGFSYTFGFVSDQNKYGLPLSLIIKPVQLGYTFIKIFL